MSDPKYDNLQLSDREQRAGAAYNPPRFNGQGIIGIVAHDGSFKMLKWDNTADCYAPHKLSNQTRLRNAIKAFLQTWGAA